jgi:hypothetical protein
MACSTPNIIIDKELLDKTEAMPVKGRQGWQINQVIRFGDYKTSKVKRGWTFSYDIPFIAQFKGAKEKLQYHQFGMDNKRAEVFCVSKFTDHYVPILGDFFGIPLKYEDHFAGTIYQKGKKHPWDFIIFTPDGGTIKNRTAGFIKNGATTIEIRGVREMEKQVYLVKFDVYGYEFLLNGKSIGAVQTVNNGRVWIDPNQSSDIKLALASVATGLILRHNPKEEGGF